MRYSPVQTTEVFHAESVLYEHRKEYAVYGRVGDTWSLVRSYPQEGGVREFFEDLSNARAHLAFFELVQHKTSWEEFRLVKITTKVEEVA